MKHLAIIVSCAFVLCACKVPQSQQADSQSEAKSIMGPSKAEVLTKITPMFGDWKLLKGDENKYQMGVLGCPDRMKVIQVKTDTGSDSKLNGMDAVSMRQIRDDGATDMRVYDRADFVNIQGWDACETIPMSPIHGAKICHKAWFSEPMTLTHRAFMGDRLGFKVFFWNAYYIPAGSSSADQSLSLADGTLTYTYKLDGKVQDTCTFIQDVK